MSEGPQQLGCRGGSRVKIIDFGQEATGFIAVGQFAVGVFALGQVATGVVAVGQMATGIITIGQGAVGFFSIGMGGVGIYWTGAMIGIGGSGFGGVIPLAPSLGKTLELPPTTSWTEARHDDWVAAELANGTDTVVGLPTGVRVHASLRRVAGAEVGPVLVHVVDGPAGLEVDRIMRVPIPRYKIPRWYAIWAVQFALLIAVCTAYVGGVILPWLQMMWSAL